MPKRAKLTGVERLFENAPASSATKPQDTAAVQPAPALKPERWDDRYHRRTFHCADANWAALEAFCRLAGMSRAAAINAALEVFLDASDE
jgi:hypothetical protein